MASKKYTIKETYNENEKGEKFGPLWAIFVTVDGVEQWAVPNQFETKAEAEKFRDEKLPK